MASTDGLMGYGYEIRLHNSEQVRGLQTWAGRLDRSADRPPLPGELQGQQPQPGEGWVKYNGLWMISRERRAALCPGKNVKCYDLQPAPAQQHHRHHNNLSSSQLRQFIIPLKSSGARRPGTANIHNKYQQKQEKSKRWRKLSEAVGERSVAALLWIFGWFNSGARGTPGGVRGQHMEMLIIHVNINPSLRDHKQPSDFHTHWLVLLKGLKTFYEVFFGILVSRKSVINVIHS